MDQSLPFRPYPQTGESPLSVMRRGAQGNFIPSTLRFAYAQNAAVDHSRSGLSTVARNATLQRSVLEPLGLSESEMRGVFYERVGKGRRDSLIWNGLQVPDGDLQFRNPKICIACYVQDRFTQSAWDHVAALACPRHLALLSDACPCCGTSWSAETGPLSCGCNPEEMLARSISCNKDVATALSRHIDTGDSEGVQLLGALWRTLRCWKTLGLPLTREVFAQALSDLSRNRWPLLRGHETEVKLHPRLALAPLLASAWPPAVSAGRALLEQFPSGISMPRIQSQTWPASTAMAILGLGRGSFKTLVRAKILTTDRFGRYAAPELNQLLWDMSGCPDHADQRQSLGHLRGAQNRKSLAWLIQQIRQGQIKNHHYAMADGIGGLFCEITPINQDLQDVEWTVDRVANRLQVNTESVRKLISLKFLIATRGGAGSAVRWAVCPQSLERFNQTYVFASSLAAERRAPIRTLASRLRSAGISPVSGPGIDDGTTYLFNRRDVSEIDLGAVLSEPYQSPAGRKKTVNTAADPKLVSGEVVAATLHVTFRQLREVVAKGWIQPVGPKNRRQQFHLQDIHVLQKTLASDYLAIRNAAEELGQTIAQFQKTWVDTGLIKIRRFANRRLASKVDLTHAKEIWRESATGSAIGNALGRGRWMCPNLSKMGCITAESRLGTGHRSVHLFPRSSPALEQYRLTHHIRPSNTADVITH